MSLVYPPRVSDASMLACAGGGNGGGDGGGLGGGGGGEGASQVLFNVPHELT